MLAEIPYEERGWEMVGVHRADLQQTLVGADGLRSVVRASLFGDEPPRSSGQVGLARRLGVPGRAPRLDLLGDLGPGPPLRPGPDRPRPPVLVQGAAQALEDAVVLGRELTGAGDAEAALRRYEQRRRKRASRIVKQSFQAGRMAQLTSPRACAVRDFLVRALPKRLALAQQARIFASDLD